MPHLAEVEEEGPMSRELTADDRARVRAALMSPTLRLVAGLGTATTPTEGDACTIAAINLALTGRLTVERHPCVCPVIHRWVISVQDAMPTEVRNSPRWRKLAIDIAGSAASRAVETRRHQVIIAWMWGVLGDPAVVAAIPESARAKWERMLAERSRATAHAAYAAGAAARIARAAGAAARAANGDDGVWRRHDPRDVLAELLAVTDRTDERGPR